MADKNPRLTAHLIEAICTRLKGGGAEKVAVESAGVSWESYQAWLSRAAKARAGKLYRRLAAEVIQAKAQARLLAEMNVRDKDAKAWLLHGPGRQTATQPGWGTAAKSDAGDIAARSNKRMFELAAMVLEALTPFPEARATVADAVERFFHKAPERS